MGVFSRLNEQKDKLTQAEDAMPGAYENRYDQGIQDALTGMDSQNSAGFDFNSQNKDYRGALSRLFGNAGAGADAAAQVAQGLSGGYGADWAKSAADQSAASGAQDGVASAMAKARADALSQWQQELAGQSSQLDTLLGQDSLERSEYDGKVKSAQNWRGYQYDRTEQARTEKNDLLGNVWDVIKNVGSAVKQGYDAYMGYDQQKLENQMAFYQMGVEAFNNGDPEQAKQLFEMGGLDSSMVDKWTESYGTRANKANSIQTAISYLKAGSPEAARETLKLSGLDETLLDNWQGMTDYEKEQLDASLSAISAKGNGNDAGGNTILKLAGLDSSAVDDFATVSGRQNQSDLNLLSGQLKLQNQYRTTTGTGSTGTGSRSSRSGSSGTTSGSTTSKNGTGYSTSQLQTMAKEFKSMKEGEPLYDFYKQTLTDAGWLAYDGVGSSGIATRRQQIAANAAQGQQGRGSDYQTIYNSLRLQGYSEDEIAYAMSTLK